jgi:hypothetical protein
MTALATTSTWMGLCPGRLSMWLSVASGESRNMSRGADGKAASAVVWEGERATENRYKIIENSCDVKYQW